MMEWLTIDALFACDHGGKVNNKPSQELVRIEDRVVLVATDPEGRSISGCPNNNPMMSMKPCLNTLVVKTGYSDFIQIDGHRVCLSSVKGLTDGTLPGTVNYTVKTPGQNLLKAAS